MRAARTKPRCARRRLGPVTRQRSCAADYPASKDGVRRIGLRGDPLRRAIPAMQNPAASPAAAKICAASADAQPRRPDRAPPRGLAGSVDIPDLVCPEPL